MDFSMAFDFINHELLIAKLYAYCFRKNSLTLKSNYLSNSWLKLKIKKNFSSWNELLQGDSQGFLPGHFLFDIFSLM